MSRRRLFILACLVIGSLGSTASAQTFSSCLLGPLRPSDGNAFASFGYSLAAEGDRVVNRRLDR